jgi:PHD/YefM family antitoxin component YafN of YafNO toxin-antitoxin module
MSAQDLESLEATVELLSDPEALRRLAQADTDLADGREVTQAEMEVEMEQRRSRERPGA